MSRNLSGAILHTITYTPPLHTRGELVREPALRVCSCLCGHNENVNLSSSLSKVAPMADTYSRASARAASGKVIFRFIGRRSIGNLPSSSLMASSACFLALLLRSTL